MEIIPARRFSSGVDDVYKRRTEQVSMADQISINLSRAGWVGLRTTRGPEKVIFEDERLQWGYKGAVSEKFEPVAPCESFSGRDRSISGTV